MDIIIRDEDISLSQVALYASISFLVVSLLGAFLYITCTKKYRLNWFEKNLLETATEKEEMSQSREALISSNVPYNFDTISECSRGTRGNVSPLSITTEDPTFWVPAKTIMQQQLQVTTNPSSSAEDSPPLTPGSPTPSTKSLTFSIGSGSYALGKIEKQFGVPSSRPRVSSMHVKLDHTKIDTNLYRNNSMSSAQHPKDTHGSIHIMILFDPIAGILSVRLIEAQNLQPRDFSGTADPYAKIRLLPDKKNMWQTRIHKKTLNPSFDEDFVFEEHPAIIGKRTIEILVYDFDSYSRHVCIGGTQIPLCNLDLSQKVEIWNPLGLCAEKDAKIDLGEVMVTCAFLPSAERLTVIVIKARNLKVVDDVKNTSDPYVKVSLWNNGKKIKKRKTGVLRSNLNPVYNEALTFDISRETLKNSTIEVIVLHDNILGPNEILGRSIIGNSENVRKEERILFDQMFRNKTATAQWLPLHDATPTNPPPSSSSSASSRPPSSAAVKN